MIKADEVEAKIHDMEDMAERIAQAKVEVMRAESMVERTKAMVFLKMKGTVEDRKMQMRESKEVQEKEEDLFVATGLFEKLKHTWEAYRATIAYFQTQSANSRIFAEAAHYTPQRSGYPPTSRGSMQR